MFTVTIILLIFQEVLLTPVPPPSVSSFIKMLIILVYLRMVMRIQQVPVLSTTIITNYIVATQQEPQLSTKINKYFITV